MWIFFYLVSIPFASGASTYIEDNNGQDVWAYVSKEYDKKYFRKQGRELLQILRPNAWF